MALTFPTSPAFGDIYYGTNGINYSWDGAKWVVYTGTLGNTSVEVIQDAAALMFLNGTNDGIAYTYDDPNNLINSRVISQYSNANVAAYLLTNGLSVGGGSLAVTNVYSSNFYWGNGTAFTGIPTYSNANVAAYLLTNTATISSPAVYSTGYFWSNGVPVSYGTTYTNANVAAFLPTNTANVGGLRFTSTQGYFWSNGAAYTVGTYGNADVAAYLTTNPGEVTAATVTSTGAVVSGSGFQWANGRAYAGTYTNANVLAYLPNNSGNVAANNLRANGSVTTTTGFFWANGASYTGSYSDLDVASYLPSYSGNLTVDTVVADSVTSTNGFFWANGSAYTGTYGNARVAAYLPINSANVAAANVHANGAVYSTTGFLWANGRAYGGTYGSSNVQAFLDSYTGNLQGDRISAAGFYWANGTAYDGSYSNAQVSAYLALHSGNVAGLSLNANASVYAGNGVYSGNGFFWANGVPYGGTYSDANVSTFLDSILPSYTGQLTAGDFTSFGSVVSTSGFFWPNGLAYGSAATPVASYGDSNVAAYLASNPTNATVVVSNVTTTVVYANTYLWGNGNALVTGTTYSNANVAAYLPTYGGTVRASAFVWPNGRAYAGTYGDSNVAAVLTAGSATIRAANVAAPSVYADGFLWSNGASILTPPTDISANSVISTTGFFWPNGLAYGSPTTYSNANVAAFLPTNTANVGGNSFFASTGFFWSNGAPLLSEESHPGLFYDTLAIGTTYQLIDSFEVIGNSAVNYVVTAKDTINGTFKTSRLDTLNDGITVFSTEYGIVSSDPMATVVDFVSNIAAGNINLYAIGDSSSVIVNVQRSLQGSSNPIGYLVGVSGAPGDVIEAQYSNANVAAYLTVNTARITSSSFVSGSFVYPNGAPYRGTYSNSNVSGVLTSHLTAIRVGNVAGTTVYGGNFLWANGTSLGDTSYRDSNVAAYLPNHAGTASASRFNSATGFYWANGNPYNTNSGINVPLILRTYTGTVTASNVWATSVTASNLRWPNGASISDTLGNQIAVIDAKTGYSNTDARAYLSVNTGNVRASNFFWNNGLSATDFLQSEIDVLNYSVSAPTATYINGLFSTAANVFATKSLTVGPGSASGAGVTVVAGNLATVATAGSMEFSSDGAFYATPATAERGLVQVNQTYVLKADRMLAGQSTTQSIFGAGTQLSANTRYGYRIDAIVGIVGNSYTNSLSYAMTGNASLSLHSFTVQSHITGATPGAVSQMASSLSSSFFVPQVVTAAIPADTSTFVGLQIDGTFDTVTGGLVVPYIGAANPFTAGSSVKAGSKISIWSLGAATTNTAVGNWLPGV